MTFHRAAGEHSMSTTKRSIFMLVRDVIQRNPLLLPLAFVATLSIVLIGESSYWQSTGVLEQLSALRSGKTTLQELRATAPDSQSSIHRTLLVNRLGAGALSAAGLVVLFLYLRQGLALEQKKEDVKEELERVVQIERERLEVEVASRTAQLVKLTHHIETAREEERARLARDLHDELGALLISAKLDAARIKARVTESAPEVLERLAHLVDMLNKGIALKHNIIENLRPSTLDSLGLAVTLEILSREFAERSGVKVNCALSVVMLEPTAELVAYRVVQEAVTNISKYAKATTLWLDLVSSDGVAELTVRDDGVGFDTSSPSTSAYGLLGMRFRVEAEHGTLVVTAAPGQGTTIQVRLPERIVEG